MASPSDLLATVATAILNLTGGTRAESDYRDDVEEIAAGSTLVQVQGITSGAQPDSNAARSLMSFVIILRHQLADPKDERAFTEGSMQTWCYSLARETWWRGVPNVFGIFDSPEIEVERVTNVVLVSITLRLVLTETFS